mmetsp:Transcript_5683/g.7622  ORF Transcript_5683/g.7622 Transcript_5683/m.7622 type:complete len:99 (-) Transcript_5683:751-1047(-)
MECNNDGKLEWRKDETQGYGGIFVSASPASNQRNVLNGVYFFEELSVKLKLHKRMFNGPRQVLRVRFETCLISEKTVRIDVSSLKGKKRIDIHSRMLC